MKRPAGRRKFRRSRLRHRRAARRTNQPVRVDWTALAYEEGEHQGKSRPGDADPAAIRRLWSEWSVPRRVIRQGGDEYGRVASAFLTGYAKGAGIERPDIVPLPTVKKTAAIVTVMNEEQAIPGIVKELERLALDELIFVVNGSDDGSFKAARRSPRALVIHYPYALGHDVGRAIGAKLAQADYLLFLDGDFSVPAEKLAPFVAALEDGADIALNDITPYIPLFSYRDPVTIVKQFLNVAMARPELHANSLTAIPHAMTRRAIEAVGYAALAVPPKAQASAILKGLRIDCPASVDVVTANRIRSHNAGLGNSVEELIVGDHIEALKLATDHRGARLGFDDAVRLRSPEAEVAAR